MTDSKMTIEEARRVIAEHEAAQEAARKASPAWQKAAEMVAAGWKGDDQWPSVDDRIDGVTGPDGRWYNVDAVYQQNDWDSVCQAAGIPEAEWENTPVIEYIREMTEQY